MARENEWSKMAYLNRSKVRLGFLTLCLRSALL